MASHVAADGAGDRRQDDIVDGAAGGVLDPLQVGEARPYPGKAPIGTDIDVERGGGRTDSGAGEGTRCLEAVDDGSRRHARRTEHGPGATNDLGRLRRTLDHRLGQHLRLARLRAGDPGLGGVERLGVGSGIEQHRRDVDPGDAVDQAVMGLGDDRKAVVLDAVDQPDLPQRLRAIKPLREDSRREDLQLLLASGGGERRVAQVVGEVELRIVDPFRTSLAKGHHAQLLAKPGHEVKPGRDVIAKLVVGRRRPLENGGRGDMHVRRTPLQVQKRRVEAGEPICGHGWIFSEPLGV